MKIKVFSELTIQSFRTDKLYAVISIQDPDYDFVKLYRPKNCKGTSKYKFYDFDAKTNQQIYDLYLFSTKDAKNILKFVDAMKDKVDLICVNCVAGISRSAGVAGAISKILNNNDEYFFKNYCPNMLVYSTILKEYYAQK